MLTVAYPGSSSLHNNFKCGEIFCASPAVFSVTCCLCRSKMHLEQFPNHFQIQHFILAEEIINLEDLDRKRKTQLAKDASLEDNIAIKEEDPENDPIKQEDLSEKITEINDNKMKKDNDFSADEQGEVDDDEDDKCLQQLINESESSKYKNEIVDSIKRASGTLKRYVSKKPFTRNAKNAWNDLEEDKKEKNQFFQIKEVKSIATLDAGNLSKGDLCFEEDNEDNEWSEKLDDSNSNSGTEKNSTEERPFSCLICNRSYPNKHGLQKHNNRVHNPARKSKGPKPQHKCDECSEVFRSERELRGHKWKHTGIFCDICGKPFTQTGNMMRHKIRHTGIKAHKCKECSKEFFTDKELKSHMICHTGLMPVICEICGKRCRDRGVLTAHMRRHTGERPAKCNVCDKSFFSFHDLNVHAVTHSSERPFTCDICGSTFQRKKALRVHKFIHLKDRKHVCKICGKGFAQTGGLNSHMRTHDAAVKKASSVEPTPVKNIPAILLESPRTHIENQQILAKNANSRTNEVQVLGEYVI